MGLQLRVFVILAVLLVFNAHTFVTPAAAAAEEEQEFVEETDYISADEVTSHAEVQEYLSWLASVKSKSDQQQSSHTADPGFFNSKDLGSGNVITVNPVKGLGNFRTIQAAVNSVPKNNTQRVIIQIAAGTYVEKVKIQKTKPYITFLGAGMNVTKITWNDTANSTGTTFKSATVSVMAHSFVARGITFENSAPPPVPGELGGQAVAFQISGDQSAIFNCAFYGAQDTLYDHKGRHYFKNCLIVGSIDFIFGDGQSIYQGCELRTIATSSGALTAQKRKLGEEDTGFVFLNCTVSGAGMVLLGRAWGAYSRVVFIYSYISDIILPGGWYDWGIPDRQKTAFYAEYKCYGPGADRQSRVAWSYELSDAQVGPFLSLNFIDGLSWLA